MAQQGGNPPGLFSKVAKLVRTPAKDWSDSQRQGSDEDNGYNKQALKAMIERKRQNDAVRKREFDHLRKLRRTDGQGSADQGGRPSFFHSSLNHDERAETLKKIDEIEAQMSRQWWKGRPESPPTSPDLFPATAPAVLAVPTPFVRAVGSPTRKIALAETPKLSEGQAPVNDLPAVRSYPDIPVTQQMPIHDIGMASQDRYDAESGFPSTLPSNSGLNELALDSKVTDSVTRPTQAPNTQTLSQFGVTEVGAEPYYGWTPTKQPLNVRNFEGAGFSSRRLFSVAGLDTQTDPDLEEVAIRFANGDDVGAEEGLLAALQGGGRAPDLLDIWMSALFDLYRATGQQVKFERAGLDFADRFGRSAPVWFSTPEMLGRSTATSASSPRKVPVKTGVPVWVCPAEVTLHDLDTLKALFTSQGASEILLDWQSIDAIEPEAVATMSEIFTRLCDMPLRLLWRGHDNLDRVLKQLTPAADRNMPAAGWQLRMDAMRVLNKSDEFELVALEYCVTYEVSPPSWQTAKCICAMEGAMERPVTDSVLSTSWGESRLAAMTSMTDTMEEAAIGALELSGEILGDAADALLRLDAEMHGKHRLEVNCARLIRVDFTAAGGLLNWAAAQQAQGHEVQFKELNRMVAAFFRVIGIHEHAQVLTRSA